MTTSSGSARMTPRQMVLKRPCSCLFKMVSQMAFKKELIFSMVLGWMGSRETSAHCHVQGSRGHSLAHWELTHLPARALGRPWIAPCSLLRRASCCWRCCPARDLPGAAPLTAIGSAGRSGLLFGAPAGLPQGRSRSAGSAGAAPRGPTCARLRRAPSVFPARLPANASHF